MKAIRRIVALLFLLLLNVMAAHQKVSAKAGAADVPQGSIVTAVFAEPLVTATAPSTAMPKSTRRAAPQAAGKKKSVIAFFSGVAWRQVPLDTARYCS